MISVILTDDHHIFREAVASLLQDEKDIAVVAQAGSAPELLARLAATECDVLVLDIMLPGRSGLEVLEQIRAERPKLPVLILSLHPEGHYAVGAIRAGADGYLTKEATGRDLVQAIRTVHSGKKFISSFLAERLGSEPSDPVLAPLS